MAWNWILGPHRGVAHTGYFNLEVSMWPTKDVGNSQGEATSGGFSPVVLSLDYLSRGSGPRDIWIAEHQMKLLACALGVLALVAAVQAVSPTLGNIVPDVTSCSSSSKTCSGNTVCFSFSVGPCCGGCSNNYCGACRSGYSCIGGGCTSTLAISTPASPDFHPFSAPLPSL